METTPGLEFEFLLAQKLSRTVAELRASMSNKEYVEWGVYYAREAQRKELANKRGR